MTQAEVYFWHNIKKPDKRFLKYTKTKYRGKDIIKIEPIYDFININGYWCSEEFAKELQDIRYKDERCRTPYEIDLFNCAYDFFMKYNDDWDAFADPDNYVRFINAMDDDFLHIFE